MTNLVRSNFQAHPFHLVSPSPWPVFTSICLLALTTSVVLTMHGFSFVQDFLYMALILVILTMSFWFRDVISEATYLGNHTLAVQMGLSMGFALFIVSEALFFMAIFWAFFHSALSPSPELGAQWPPKGIDSVNPFELPLLNTVILLSSGFTITYAHHSLIQGNRKGALNGTVLTVVLALIFTGLQGLEYTVSSFTLSDSTYGSCFYFGTGFHGLNNVAPYIIIYILLKTKEIYIKNKLLIHIASDFSCSTDFSSFFSCSFSSLSEEKEQEEKANNYCLQKNLLEWFVGFTDAQGNFNIKITGLSENTFLSLHFK